MFIIAAFRTWNLAFHNLCETSARVSQHLARASQLASCKRGWNLRGFNWHYARWIVHDGKENGGDCLGYYPWIHREQTRTTNQITSGQTVFSQGLNPSSYIMWEVRWANWKPIYYSGGVYGCGERSKSRLLDPYCTVTNRFIQIVSTSGTSPVEEVINAVKHRRMKHNFTGQ
jgi:hypothetical protein